MFIIEPHGYIFSSWGKEGGRGGGRGKKRLIKAIDDVDSVV